MNIDRPKTDTFNWVLCPVRGGLSYTIKAVQTFLAQDIGRVRVMLIDNDSPDGTLFWAFSQHPHVLTIPRRPGLGVAESWNLGLEHLFNYCLEEYVLVVNNDVELRPDTYRHLVEDGGAFVTAVGRDHKKHIRPFDVEFDELAITALQEMDPNYEVATHPGYPVPNPDKKRPHPDFSCFLIRRECWETVGPFNADYKGAFVEDNEYHVRMHREGIEAYCLDLPFYHVGSATIDALHWKEKEELIDHANRNRQQFFDTYGCMPGTKEYEQLFR